MLKVWGRRSAFNVQKVMWLIDELGLPHEHVPAGGSFGGIDQPDFLALNPNGRVPVIQDVDGTVVWESHSILRYLAATYGAAQGDGVLWPDDAAGRSQRDRWMDWSLSRLQPALIDGIFMPLCRTPEAQRDLALIERSIAQCATSFQVLDAILQTRDFLEGDRLTLADIPAGTCLYRYFQLDIPRPPLPSVMAWYQRLQARPAYREHVMVAF
jgi:glutathione S-transferase